MRAAAELGRSAVAGSGCMRAEEEGKDVLVGNPPSFSSSAWLAPLALCLRGLL